MRLGVLRSIGHNVADSIASGIGFMIGVYEMDIWGEAARVDPGFIEVDFLTGDVKGSPVSDSLARALARYVAVMPDFCVKNGASIDDFQELRARFGTDLVAGPYFRVSVTDLKGRSAEDVYVGSSGERPKFKRSRA